MQSLYKTQVIPDYLMKTTLGLSLVTVLVATPLSLSSFSQGQYFLGILTLVLAFICAVNAWHSFRGHYHREVSLFGVVPIMTLTLVYALYGFGLAGASWAYFGALVFYLVLPAILARVANIAYLMLVIPLAFNVLEQIEAIQFAVVLVGLSIYVLISTAVTTRQHYMLKEQAVTDSLTGLYSNTFLQYSLEYAIQQRDRSGTNMTLIKLDINNFKMINDEHGPDVGDSILRALGDCLNGFFRASDIVFRTGEEEFLALIYNADEANGVLIGEKLQTRIEGLPLSPNVPVTVSLGVAALESNDSWEEWVKRCGENLSRARLSDRNRV